MLELLPILPELEPSWLELDPRLELDCEDGVEDDELGLVDEDDWPRTLPAVSDNNPPHNKLVTFRCFIFHSLC